MDWQPPRSRRGCRSVVLNADRRRWSLLRTHHRSTLARHFDQGRRLMRTDTVALVAILLLTPLGARAADLVVWWEKGYYAQEDDAVREIIAAFEQKTGKRVELVQPSQDDMEAKVLAAVEAGEPPDYLFGTNTDYYYGQWAYDDRLVDLSDVVRPVRKPVRPGRAQLRHVARRDHRPPRPLRAADGLRHPPRPRLAQPARAGRVHHR